MILFEFLRLLIENSLNGLQWKRLDDRLRNQVAKRDDDADVKVRAQLRRNAGQRPTVRRYAGCFNILAHRIVFALARGDGRQFGNRIERIVWPALTVVRT